MWISTFRQWISFSCSGFWYLVCGFRIWSGFRGFRFLGGPWRVGRVTSWPHDFDGCTDTSASSRLEAPALHTLRLIARRPWRHCVSSLRWAHWLASSLKLASRCPVSGCWPSCCYCHISKMLLIMQNYLNLVVWRVDYWILTSWPCDELVMWRVDWQLMTVS